MYIDKLSKQQIKGMFREYLAMTVGEERCEKWLKRGVQVTKEEDGLVHVVAKDYAAKLCFGVEGYFTDFSAPLTCAVTLVQDQIDKKHRINMYRNFGTEYLNALDEAGRRPIQENYDKKMAEHNQQMKDIEDFVM